MTKAIYAFLGFLLLFQTGCEKPPAAHVKKERMLHLASLSDARSLDPRFANDHPSSSLIKILYEGLIRIDLQGKPAPALAKCYEISEDQKIYTFHLRQSQWSNGDPVTARDFEYSWKSILSLSSNLSNPAVHFFYCIKNVQALLHGKATLEEVGIRVLDEYTLQVELEYPAPYFLELLATSCYAPVPEKWDQRHPNWHHHAGPLFISNGPFSLASWEKNNTLTVVKNPNYWDAAHVRLPGIQIMVIPDLTTQLYLFEKGELDWLGTPFCRFPLEAIALLKQSEGLSQTPLLEVGLCFLNTEVFPLNNKKFRKALSYALNRTDITEHLLQSTAIPALGVLPFTLALQEEPYFKNDNREVAKQLFAEALEELNISKDELPRLTLSYPQNAHWQRVCTVLQQQWKQCFGISVKLQTEDWKTYYEKMISGNFQIGAMAWVSVLRNPIDILQTFLYRADRTNMSRWEHPSYQALLNASQQESDELTRKDLLHRAENLLMEEMPLIPIYFGKTAYVKKAALKNVYLSELKEIDFTWAYFEE